MASSTRNPIRIALLVCDTPLPDVIATHGRYDTIFGTLLAASVPAGVQYTMNAYDVVTKMEYPSHDEKLDGIILTGSAASAYENVEWINKLTAYVADIAKTKPHIKIFGICFGHQIVGRALGGECVPNGGKWEVGTTPVTLSDAGRRVFGGDVLNIHQMHRDHVPEVPSPFLPLGSTSIAPNQGMVLYSEGASGAERPLTDVHILTLQGHPEFTSAISKLVIAAREGTGVIPADLAADARHRNDAMENDGVKVGRVIWKVLGAGA